MDGRALRKRKNIFNLYKIKREIGKEYFKGMHIGTNVSIATG